MDNEQLLARLTGRLYDAGLGADSWDATLDDIVQGVGAEASALFVEDLFHRQMARANAVADGLVIVLNHFQTPVLLVNERGAVIECNLAAETLLRRPECPLGLAARRLSVVSIGDTATLARAISEAACASVGTLSVAARNDERPDAQSRAVPTQIS